ncbi:hypothetical protein Lqui_1676 [Legionella quinlivanii]|uniref:Mevalonate kinase n=1 Tax=Legionella quinlivanii TaxID=45073 RepID=A0A0W0Y0X3_9GAMM|nr:hypothetical protein [Legionella quinlivanii]KTD50351.1 hypothetical protein Lqui_1676 [Legionella quinlivanii]SEF42678.1 Mevalonate kinase [Legionella quinlivanii DSM 21216]STY11951.1 mevalonate kinase [Legionella quinlivanii]
MKWSIPAKTFLIGEYAAVIGKSAIVLTTSPCFELRINSTEEIQGIHPESPAGKWWSRQKQAGVGLSWFDPYQGQGGLGASSAQFLGAYLASCYLQKVTPTQENLLNAYFECAWSGNGLRPSGYDVLAQSNHHCVYINREQNILDCYHWPFPDIAILLLHSGKKLATHHHLQDMTLPDAIHLLPSIVEQAKTAFEHKDSQSLIDAINTYHQRLSEMGLVAEHSCQQIRDLKADKSVLAAKGCGALGADVLLIAVAAEQLNEQKIKLANEGWTIIASTEHLYAGEALI